MRHCSKISFVVAPQTVDALDVEQIVFFTPRELFILRPLEVLAALLASVILVAIYPPEVRPPSKGRLAGGCAASARP